jgi:hypothetical protein
MRADGAGGVATGRGPHPSGTLALALYTRPRTSRGASRASSR